MSVYFIQSACGAVKIGRAVNVERRLAALQTAHAHPLTLLRAIDGGPVEEWECQEVFREARIRGEWFEYREEMMTFQPSGASKVVLLRARRDRTALDDRLAPKTAVAAVRQAARANALPQKVIAKRMGLSASSLSRKLIQDPSDSHRFNLDDLERFVECTGDTSPVLYLVEKYLANKTSEIEELEKRLAELRARPVRSVG